MDVAAASATADTALTLVSLKAAAATMAHTETLATAQQLATEAFHLLRLHLCGPDTALTIARTKVLLATGC